MFSHLTRRIVEKFKHDVPRDATNILDAVTAELKGYEQSFKLLFDSNPIPMWLMDVESLKIQAVNNAAVKHYGFTREQFLSLTALDIRLPEDRDDFSRYVGAGSNSQGRKLWRHRKKNGEIILVSVYSGDLAYSGRPVRLCAVIDVTERIRAEEMLLEQKVQIDTTLNTMSQGVLLFDAEGRLVLCNRRYIEMYNLSPDVVKPGCTLQELVAHRKSLGLFSEDIEQYCREVMGAVAKGADTIRIIELSDGRSIHAVNHPVGDGRWVATHEDITERKKVQTRLSQESNDNRRLFETSLDLILVTDGYGNLTRVSPSALAILGYDPKEMIGHNAIDFIHPDDLDSTREEMRSARRGKLMRNFETRYVHKLGNVVILQWSGVWSEPAQQYYFSGRDITEQRATDQKFRAAESQLRQAQKMESIGQLTGGIAHDFNNLLTVITGTIDILEGAVSDKPEMVTITKLISEAASRGAELTGHLLAFARKQPLQPRQTDVNALMAGAEALLRRALGEQIEITMKIDADAWPAMVDPTQLSTALLNLAVNARDAMPSGGKLTLETTNVVIDQSYSDTNQEIEPGEYLLLAVSDTGTGMSQSIRQKVFEPFFTTKGIGKGTGLGLSMVYGFVKQSGGHIKIYSEEGHGTTFRIYFPRAGGLADQPGQLFREARNVGGTETILVVEDDPMVRASAATQLTSLGYKTLFASNAAEALAIANEEPFDLLFTDVIMPGQMNGRELAEAMAGLRSPLKVLFTSGYTENAVIHHGRLEPGVLLLAKPYRKDELARMLRRALDGHEPLRSLASQQMKGRAG
jgi:PAS domain S-box-containing protein